jgi:putative ABC transport system substrate-binding protein
LTLLRNPENSSHVPAAKAAEETSRSLGVVVRPLDVRGPADLDTVFAALRRERPDGIVFLADPVFFIHLRRLTELITELRVPAASNFTEFPKLGDLIGYAPSLAEEFRRLKGAKAGDLPIEQPTKFELVINLRTAKSLGLTSAIPAAARGQRHRLTADAPSMDGDRSA